MISKFQIIVLHTIKHGDSGMVIQCYSDTAGRMSVYLRGASRKGTVLANLHRLNILDIVTYSTGSSMPAIREMAPAVMLPSVRTDIYKNSIAIFISELLTKSIREVEPNPVLYNFLASSIQLLEHSREGIANFHIYFLVHLSKMMGFMPLDNYSPDTPVFNILSADFGEIDTGRHPYAGPDREMPPAYSGGCLTDAGKYSGSASVPERSFDFSAAESALLHRILNTPVTSLGEIKCRGELRFSFAKQMVRYLSHHLGSPLEIKSLDILHEVFK